MMVISSIRKPAALLVLKGSVHKWLHNPVCIAGRSIRQSAKACTLSCDGSMFYSSYSGWNKVRNFVVRATLQHLQNSFVEQSQKKQLTKTRQSREGKEDNQEEQDEKEVDYEESYRRSDFEHYQKTVLKMISEMKSARPLLQMKAAAMRMPGLPADFFDNDLHAFYTVALPNRNYVDALNHFGCGGLVALCAANDCGGYYTPGNAWDIWHLLTTIRPTLTATVPKDDLDWWCDEVIEMFHTAWTSKKNISIG